MRSPKITMTERQLAKKLAREWNSGWKAAQKISSVVLPCKTWERQQGLVQGLTLLRAAGLLSRNVEYVYTSRDYNVKLTVLSARQIQARAAARAREARRDRAMARKAVR